MFKKAVQFLYRHVWTLIAAMAILVFLFPQYQTIVLILGSITFLPYIYYLLKNSNASQNIFYVICVAVLINIPIMLVYGEDSMIAKFVMLGAVTIVAIYICTHREEFQGY